MATTFSSSLLLLLLLALLAASVTLTQAFAPGASVGASRSGRVATAFWGLGGGGGGSSSKQGALTRRLMATRGGVAGGKVRGWDGD
jgi:hypothetical protein